ncbi:hypothetical protein HYALB_00000749 [Hymenoscyphus albidus]|uniref:Glucose receptor Git3-like N-terminal domain-containing protein n=1 Tax=Hymenoscyphus albidus TaxID=595503 RepID=A0A9N9Q841_9HELO|nr:hypothetical protein HYALB_00000749 [Hymenoscyphus albidus]
MASIDLAVAIPTLIGSLLSCFASGLIFCCYIFLPQIPHFRHILIINLAAADFINSFNNTVSGLWILGNGDLSVGGKCSLNGWLGQLSVQGVDFAILLIAIATVMSLLGKHGMFDTSIKSKVILTTAVWLMPVITSFTALGLKAYTPVSGNWCWISAEKPILRYGLTHVWRFIIIFVTVCLYVYLYIYFRSELKEIAALRRPSDASFATSIMDAPKEEDEEFEMRDKEMRLNSFSHEDDSVPISSSKALTNFTSYEQQYGSATHEQTLEYDRSASLVKKQREIQKVLLLNAYPIAYVILWLPGLINRLNELNGNHSRVLQIMQSSSQFVGLANAITYGYNEGIKRQMRKWWTKKSGQSNQRGMV